jgi:hypothetical protein
MKLLILLPTLLGLVFSTAYCVKRVGPRGLLWGLTFLFAADYMIAKMRWAVAIPFLIMILGICASAALASVLGISFAEP